MAVLREKGSAAIEFQGTAPLRDAQRSIPSALLDGEDRDAGLNEDQQVEVAMLMNETAVDFDFLQHCGQNTEVREVSRVPLVSLFPTPPSQHPTRSGAHPRPMNRVLAQAGVV